MGPQKDNILSLGYRDVVCPLVKAADPVSWILFVCFLALLTTSIVLRVITGADGDGLYSRYYALFWYGAWAIFVLSTVGPIFTIAREHGQAPLGVLVGIGVMHLVTFILMSVVVLIQLRKHDAITGLMAAAAAAVMVGIGWVVQHQSSAKASRRAHTFNILMQSRLSAEFQQQVKRRTSFYSAGTVVGAVDAHLIDVDGLVKCKADLEAGRSRELEQATPEHHAQINERYDSEVELVERKHESLQGVKYLLNFYEFICAGIRLREIDEPLIQATLSDIATQLYSDSKYVRHHCRRGQAKVYVELDHIVRDRWGGDD